MRIALLCALLVGVGHAPTLAAQPWQTIALDDLTAFRGDPVGWTVAASVTAHPFDDAVWKVAKGTGVLVNDPGKRGGTDIYTQLEHGDLELELEVLLPPGSNSGIYLQGRYEIQLRDSWQQTTPTFADMGGLYERWNEARPDGQKGFAGRAPRVNASRAPGLWQKVELSFQAPRFDAQNRKTDDARLLFLRINGSTVHENLILTGPTRGTMGAAVRRGPLRIQGDHGPVALRHIRYRTNLHPPLSWKNLRYEVAPYTAHEPPDWSDVDIAYRGTTSLLTMEAAREQQKFALRYRGQIELPATGQYYFWLTSQGRGRLLIDGRPVIDQPGWQNQDSLVLEAGTHTFEVSYNKPENWYAKSLGLYISGPDMIRQPLHAATSIPLGRMPRAIHADYEQRPTLLRSFVDVPLPNGEARRLTHAINVGYPPGMAFSYDLSQGTLAQAWRGPFLDATPMWHERGDARSIPRGSVQPFALKPLYEADDTLVVRSQGYALDEDGVPTFRYTVDSTSVNDRIVPAGDDQLFLTRSLDWATDFPTGTRLVLAEGRDIVAVAKNLYRVDAAYYLRFPDKSSYTLDLQSADARMQLVFLPQGSTSLQYDIIW